MRRPLLFVMTSSLALASIVLAMTAASLTPGSGSQASTQLDGIAVVQRYYDAVNEMIATGDPASFREVVGSDLVDLEPSLSGYSGRDGIEQYLRLLHAAVPNARIEPQSIAQDGGQVTVHLSLRGESPSTMLGFALDAELPFWPEVEVSRILRGQIIERDVNPAGTIVLSPESGLPFDLAVPAGRELTARYNTYAPGAVGTFATIDVPEILRILDGELSVTLPGTATDPAYITVPSPVGEIHSRHTLLSYHSRMLAPGDVVVIPPGSEFSVANRSDSPASLLRISATIPPAPDAEPILFTQTPQPGIKVQTQARLDPSELGGPAQLSFGTVTLMPGGRLTTSTETRLAFACTTSSPYRCLTYGRDDDKADLATVYPHVDDASAASPLLLLAPNSESTVLINAGVEPASAWILAVTVGTSG